MNIDNTLCFCDQVGYVILKTSCQTNFCCTWLQFRGMGPVLWLMRELPCKNVEKIVSKVIIIACDHQLVSKMPKKRRKNEENRLFPPKPGFRQSWTKVLPDSTAIFIFFCYFSVPSLNSAAFSKFLAVLVPPPYTKLKLGKKFWIHTSNIVCGVSGGVGPV